MFKATPTKKEGTPIEFHEFLCCVWLEYLLKIGHHDNTFQMSHIRERLNQFKNLIEYDKMMDTGPIGGEANGNLNTTNNALDNSRINMINKNTEMVKVNSIN